DSLIGRLQRGRGDAVRELLRMPVEPARQVLVQCLCTEANLSLHIEGFVELALSLSPDLSPWHRWIDGLGSDVTEEARLFVFNTLGELAARGHSESRVFLHRYVMQGRHWRDALSQYLADQLSLELADWVVLLPRVDDETLAV